MRRIASCSCGPQSQRREPNTSPVRHSLWTRTSTGSSAAATSPHTRARWVTSSASDAEGEAPEGAELGRQPGVGDAVDDRAVSQRHLASPDPSARRRPARETEVNRPRRSTSIVGAPGPANSADGVVAAEHRRGEVHDVAVDEPGVVEGVGDGRPALDQQLQDAAAAELVEHRAEVAASARGTGGPWRPRAPGRARRAAGRARRRGGRSATDRRPARCRRRRGRAWLSARSRWASARASGPVIHWLVPSGAAVRPSTVAASLSTT